MASDKWVTVSLGVAALALVTFGVHAKLATDRARARSPEQLAAAGDAARVLDRASGVGHWTRDDVRALRPQLARMQPDDRMQAMSRLVQMINQDRVTVDYKGPPF
jgi:hypothetical protein